MLWLGAAAFAFVLARVEWAPTGPTIGFGAFAAAAGVNLAGQAVACRLAARPTGAAGARRLAAACRHVMLLVTASLTGVLAADGLSPSISRVGMLVAILPAFQILFFAWLTANTVAAAAANPLTTPQPDRPPRAGAREGGAERRGQW